MNENGQKIMALENVPLERGNEFMLSDYIRIIEKRKVMIGIFALTCLVLSIFYNIFSPRIYKATTSIVIPPKPKSSLLSSTDITLPGSTADSEKDFNTEVQKIKSNYIAGIALDILINKGYFKDEQGGLQKNELPGGSAMAAQSAPSGESGAQEAGSGAGMETAAVATEEAATPEQSAAPKGPVGLNFPPENREILKAYDSAKNSDVRNELIDLVMQAVSVNPVKNTNVVEISAINRDPILARDMANAMADAFARYSEEYKYGADTESLRYLTDEIESIRQNLLKSELSLNEYRAHNNLLEPTMSQELYVSKRSDLDKTLLDLRNQRLDAEARIKELQVILDSPIEDVVLPEASAVPSGKLTIFDGLREKIIEAQMKKNELASFVTTRNLDYQAAQSQISMLNGRLREEIKKIIKGLKFEIEIISNKEKMVLDIIQSVDDLANEQQKQSIQYLVLQRDAESYKWLYQYLLGSVLVAEINANKSQESVEIFSYAELPEDPIRPKILVNIILALVIGLFGGIGLALIVENMDQAIVKAEEVEDLTGVPLLSILPHLMPEVSEKEKMLIVENYPQDHFSEGISRLWLNLRPLIELQQLDSIIVTSALAMEGKTTISANLAAVSGKNKRTVLLGCDFRKPSLKRFFLPDKQSKGGLNNSIDLLYVHPMDVELEEMTFGDLHTLLKAQKLSGSVEVLGDGGEKPLRLNYQNGKVTSSNIGSWKNAHPDVSIKRFLEKSRVNFNETHWDEAPGKIENGESIDIELNSMLDNIPARGLMAKMIKDYAIKEQGKTLWVLEAAKINYSPSDLIGSSGMRELVRILKLSFDMVIIDTPPSMPFADINAFSGIMKNILLIVRSDSISRKIVVRNINWLRQLNFNMLGYAFNDTKMSRDSYYYYGYYSYRQYRKKGYGYYSEYGKEKPES